MPIYEFVCCECCHEFEHLVLQSNEPKPNCPCCKSDSVDRRMSASCIRPQGIPAGSGGFAGPKCKPAGGG